MITTTKLIEEIRHCLAAKKRWPLQGSYMSIEAFREKLPELQIQWLKMDRDHQMYGCRSIPYFLRGQPMTQLELHNAHLSMMIDWCSTFLYVRSGANGYIAVTLEMRGKVTYEAGDVFALLMYNALHACKGRKVLTAKREAIEWSWRELMKVFAPVEVENIAEVYNYDE